MVVYVAVLAIGVTTGGQSSPAPRQTAGSEAEADRKNICGPLALATAATYLGRPESFDRVFGLLPPTGNPRSLGELKGAAERLGLTTTAVRWRRGEIPALPGPAIIRLDPSAAGNDAHFVLLVHAAGKRLEVLDMPHPPRWVPAQDLWQVAVHGLNCLLRAG